VHLLERKEFILIEMHGKTTIKNIIEEIVRQVGYLPELFGES
jgi:hypothetical protein